MQSTVVIYGKVCVFCTVYTEYLTENQKKLEKQKTLLGIAPGSSIGMREPELGLKGLGGNHRGERTAQEGRISAKNYSQG